jgi:hypothetical protein
MFITVNHVRPQSLFAGEKQDRADSKASEQLKIKKKGEVL